MSTQRHPYIMIDSRGNEVLYSKMGKRIRKTLKNGQPSKAYTDAKGYPIETSKPEWAKKAVKAKKATKAKPYSLTRKYAWNDPATQKAVQKLKEIESFYNSIKSGGIPATKDALRARAKDFVSLYRRYKINPNENIDIQEYAPTNVKYKYASCPTNTDDCADNLKYSLATGEKCCRKPDYYSQINLMAKRKKSTKKTAKKKTTKKAAKKTAKRKPCAAGKRRSRATGRCRKV